METELLGISGKSLSQRSALSFSQRLQQERDIPEALIERCRSPSQSEIPSVR
jgi:hypothetical protein